MTQEATETTLAQFDRFPPTVVDHEEYDDGVDLELLDGGTTNKPRLIRVFNSPEKDAEYYL